MSEMTLASVNEDARTTPPMRSAVAFGIWMGLSLSSWAMLGALVIILY